MTSPLLVPHLGVEHAPGQDLVWCASLDLAWRALREAVGEPPALAPPGGVGGVELDRALSLVRALNATPPREFVCRSPFLVMLLRRGAPLPFLAVWVETAALLRRR